jgi:hypothetical protein
MPGLSPSHPARRTPFRFAPRPRNFSVGASMLSGTPASLPVRSQNLEADFHSPPTTSLLPDRHGGVRVPALPLQLCGAISVGPVRSDLHPRPVSRTAWGLLQPKPVAFSSCATPACRAESSLPFRASTLPDQSTRSRWPTGNLLPGTPDLPSLPTGGRIRYQHQRIIVPAPLRPFQLAVP